LLYTAPHNNLFPDIHNLTPRSSQATNVHSRFAENIKRSTGLPYPTTVLPRDARFVSQNSSQGNRSAANPFLPKTHQATVVEGAPIVRGPRRTRTPSSARVGRNPNMPVQSSVAGVALGMIASQHHNSQAPSFPNPPAHDHFHMNGG